MRLSNFVSKYDNITVIFFTKSIHDKVEEALKLEDEKTLHQLFCEEKNPNAKKFLVGLFDPDRNCQETHQSLIQLLIKAFSNEDLLKICAYQDDRGCPIACLLFQNNNATNAIGDFLDKLNKTEIRKILQMKDPHGRTAAALAFSHQPPETCLLLFQKAGSYLMARLTFVAHRQGKTPSVTKSKLAALWQLLITQLEDWRLVDIFAKEISDKTTLLTDLITRQDLVDCQALINRLDASILDEIFLTINQIEGTVRIAHVFKYQDSTICQFLLHKVTPQKLIEACHREEVIKSLFTRQDFATIQLFLKIIGNRGLLKMCEGINFLNLQRREIIKSNSTLHLKKKKNL